MGDKDSLTMEPPKRLKTHEKAHIGAYIDPELKEELERLAIIENRSLSGMMEFFLARGVCHHYERSGRQSPIKMPTL